MRNLKKFLAVLVVVAMIAGSFMTAFAADATTTATAKTDAEICKALGVLQGDGANGVDATYLAKGTLRYQAVILTARLLGKEAAAKAYTGTENFKDVSALNAENKAILGYAKANPSMGWVGDTATGKFDPMGKATPQMIYKVLLTALGYVEGTDFNYADTIGFAKAKGLKAIADVTALTNNDVAKAMVEGLKAKIADGSKTLITKLVEVDKTITNNAVATVATELGYTATPAAAKDFTLSATNFKEVVVTFSEAIDAAKAGNTAGAADNFVASTGAVSVDSVAADNKSVTLSLAVPMTATNNTVDITVKKAVLGSAADVKKTLANVLDAQMPSIVSAVAEGNSVIKVTMSEPVQSFANSGEYKLDGNYFSQSAVPAVSGRVLTIATAARMTKGEHTLTLSSSIKDYANYGIATTRDVKFTVAEDTTPATVSLVSASQTKLTVKFSEKITALANATVTFSNGATGVSVANPSGDMTTFEISVTGNFFPATGTTKATFAKAGIVDMFGNVPTADLTLDFTAVADVARPEVKSVEFASDVQNKLYVTYSKEVALDGAYTLTETKSDATTAIFNSGVNLNQAYYVDTTVTPNVTVKTKVVLTLGGNANYTSTSSYALLVKGTTDGPNPLANKVADYYVTGVKVKDLTAPVYSGINVNGQSMYITFDDAIDAATAVAANFVYVKADNTIVNGIPSSATIALINSNKTIKITWPTAAVDTTNGLNPATILQIQYTGLKGTDGNAITSAVKVKGGGWSGAAAPVTISSAKVTGTNTVVVQLANFSNYVFDPAKALNDIVISNPGANSTILKTSPVYDSTNGTITFTTVQSFGKNGQIASLNYAVYTAGTVTSVDIFDTAMGAEIPGKVVADNIAPAVTSDAIATSDGKVFKINLDEDLNLANNAVLTGTREFSVIVDGALVPTAAVTYDATNKQIVVDIFTTPGLTLASGKTITISFSPVSTSTVSDAATNNLAAFTKSYTRP